ncbi:MAG: LptF/LptG family permease, partial [Treponema sp.]|nr:LptF/LptG family permease [Treponema sp.]
RASGFSYRYLVRPVLFLGLAISVLSFFVNDYLLPLGTIKFNRLRLEILRSNPAIQLETNAVKNFNNATLVTGNVSDENVSDVVLIDKGNDGSLRIVSALDSMLTSGRREGVLLNMNMSDVTSIFIDQKNAKNFDVVKAGKVTLNIFDSAFISDYESVSPSEMTAYDLAKSVRKMRKEKSTDDYTLNIYTLEYNKKFSLPFGSFFFALLALPLALLFGKQNGQTIGMILGIVISFFYWAMMILGQYAASRNGFSGFWSMWIPNIVIGVSAFLFYTTLRKK